jgi:hypothetical protein
MPLRVHHRSPSLTASIRRPGTARAYHQQASHPELHPETKNPQSHAAHAQAQTRRSPEQSASVSSRVLLATATQDPFQCQACLEGTYCYQNFLTRCPAHSNSQNQSDNVNDCLCKAWFYQNTSFSAGVACLLCSLNLFCPGGGEAIACHEHSLSALGSYARTQCICDAGPRNGNQIPPPLDGSCSSRLGRGMGGQNGPQADADSMRHPRHSMTA